jgi:hypothetical protein
MSARVNTTVVYADRFVPDETADFILAFRPGVRESEVMSDGKSEA